MNCKIEHCTNKLSKREVCQTHYKKLLGTPALPRLRDYPKPRNEGCSYEGCENEFYARDWCKNHYMKWRYNGTPDGYTPQPCGTLASYSRGCRCEPCKEARREYAAEWAEEALETLHCGHVSKYQAGCRCTNCYTAFKASLIQHNEHGTHARYQGGCRCEPCKEAYSEYRRNHRNGNEDYRLAGLARQANARARVAGVPGELTVDDLAILFATFTECLACGTTEDLSIDHVVPMSMGGDNTLENCQILCGPDNTRKFKKSTDFRPEKGRELIRARQQTEQLHEAA